MTVDKLSGVFVAESLSSRGLHGISRCHQFTAYLYTELDVKTIESCHNNGSREIQQNGHSFVIEKVVSPGDSSALPFHSRTRSQTVPFVPLKTDVTQIHCSTPVSRSRTILEHIITSRMRDRWKMHLVAPLAM